LQLQKQQQHHNQTEINIISETGELVEEEENLLQQYMSKGYTREQAVGLYFRQKNQHLNKMPSQVIIPVIFRYSKQPHKCFYF